MSKLFEKILGRKIICYHRYGISHKTPEGKSYTVIEMQDDPTMVPKALMAGKWKLRSNMGLLYGPGIYTTYDWSDSFNGGNKMRRSNMMTSPANTYGPYIMELSVSSDKLFFFDPKAYEDYYGELPEKFIEEQAAKFKIELPEKMSSRKIKSMKYNGKWALETVKFLGKETIGDFFDGILYNGETDGHCCVIYNLSIIDVLGYHTPVKPETLARKGYRGSYHDGNMDKLIPL
jgi:hypothetical protein